MLDPGADSSTQRTLSASAVTVERFESITFTRAGSENGMCKNRSHAAGSSSINFRIVASKGLVIAISFKTGRHGRPVRGLSLALTYDYFSNLRRNRLLDRSFASRSASELNKPLFGALFPEVPGGGSILFRYDGR